MKEEAHEKNWDNRIPGKNGYLKKVLIFFTCDDNFSIDFCYIGISCLIVFTLLARNRNRLKFKLNKVMVVNILSCL